MKENQIIAYLDKKLDNKDMIEVDLWISKSSENMAFFSEVRKKWTVQKNLQYKMEKAAKYGSESSKNKPKKSYRNETSYHSETPNVRAQKPKTVVVFGVMAALIAFGAAVAVFTAVKEESPNEVSTEVGMLELNTVDEVEVVFLSDGSTITVYDHSTLYYPPEFGDEDRNVELNGAAYFDIVDNGEKFIIQLPNDSYVETRKAAVQLTYNETDNNTEVYVSEGKIKLYNEQDSYRLTKGAFGTFDNLTGELDLLSEGS